MFAEENGQDNKVEEVFYDSSEVALTPIPEGKPEISLNAKTDTPCHNTMRLCGKIGNGMDVILVDSRSTHNFLDPSIVRKNHIPLTGGNN